jgi:hypothetical protein
MSLLFAHASRENRGKQNGSSTRDHDQNKQWGMNILSSFVIAKFEQTTSFDSPIRAERTLTGELMVNWAKAEPARATTETAVAKNFIVVCWCCLLLVDKGRGRSVSLKVDSKSER